LPVPYGLPLAYPLPVPYALPVPYGLTGAIWTTGTSYHSGSPHYRPILLNVAGVNPNPIYTPDSSQIPCPHWEFKIKHMAETEFRLSEAIRITQERTAKGSMISSNNVYFGPVQFFKDSNGLCTHNEYLPSVRCQIDGGCTHLGRCRSFHCSRTGHLFVDLSDASCFYPV
jgi:hypothetical protein